ncbi:hypothetical protein PanWU01x14_016320 [Parasponia andersonii]|uniref:Uncharacterized protein n=1 Tax=Parasponia andersonii TaxID=3476 RepID=A0A2P5DZN2_PARAD|nr:hypothetical protein PanWU01x14_016320 [Parasponia andersonii]
MDMIMAVFYARVCLRVDTVIDKTQSKLKPNSFSYESHQTNEKQGLFQNFQHYDETEK